MHILFLSQVLPYPLDAGPKVRSYYVLRHLARRHPVTLLTFIRQTDQPADIGHLCNFCQAVHTVPMRRSRLTDLKFLTHSLFTGQPFLIARDYVPAMVTKINQLLTENSFDAIHADQLWMAQYARAASAAQPRAKLVLDQHNAVHLIPRRLAADTTNPLKRLILRREARVMARYEAKICRQFDHTVWVTALDRQAVDSLPAEASSRQAASTVIPICTDPPAVQPFSGADGRRRITFLGGLHWPPNAEGILWFAQAIFPQIVAACPNTALTVIGQRPPAGLAGPGVEITGYVSDLTPYLAETAVFLVPLRAGGGMRVKILDAWSWGLPVVSTTIGAEGIETRHGENILIADTPAEFAQAVIQVLENPALAGRLRQGGRQTVTEKYNWRTTYAAWDDIYRETIPLPGATGAAQ